MASILLLLQTVHQNVHQNEMKPNYSKPLIFTGGVNISQWKKLSIEDRKNVISREWYV